MVKKFSGSTITNFPSPINFLTLRLDQGDDRYQYKLINNVALDTPRRYTACKVSGTVMIKQSTRLTCWIKMLRRKQIKSKEQSIAGLELEKSGDTTGAIKLYEKATVTDPTNHHAWNRLMILYRKTRSKEDEVRLIKLAINSYQEAIRTKQEEWAKLNSEKAENTRELAQVLGLLEPTGLPKSDDTTIEKWQTRLYLLEYRIKNARKAKTAKKKPKTSKPKPKTEIAITKQKPKKITTKQSTKK